MKVLILTTNTGGGHNAAAKAIEEEAERRGISCTIENFMQFVPKYKEQIVVQGHAFSYRYLPKTYGVCYHLVEKQKSGGQKLFREYAKYAGALKDFILEGQYDTVIAVHIFAGLMLTEIRKAFQLPIRQYLVITDYTCSPGASTCEMDAWFVPAGLKQLFLDEGISAEHLVESGIPCSRQVYTVISKEDAKIRLNFDPKVPLVVLCVGTSSAPHVLKIVRKLLKARKDWHIVVLCGGRVKIAHLIGQLKNNRVQGVKYTHMMMMWMKAADVWITKAGGLTVTEAASCGVPLILTEDVPGVESYNVQYFCEHGLARTVKHTNALVREAQILINDTVLSNRMLQAQKQQFSEIAVEKVMDHIEANRISGETV